MPNANAATTKPKRRANKNKPNWEKASNRIWAQFDDLGWPLHQSVHVHNHSNDAGWDLRFYLFDKDQ